VAIAQIDRLGIYDIRQNERETPIKEYPLQAVGVVQNLEFMKEEDLLLLATNECIRFYDIESRSLEEKQ
jgi:hypothetical protein